MSIELNFNEFIKIVQILPKEISVMMRGRHGIGKSSLAKNIANKLNLPFIDRRLSQMSDGDLIGIPKEGKNGDTKFLPPDWFKKAMENPHLIFLDEFDRADKSIQQAGMELILDRRIMGNEIHPDCRVFSAINGGKHGSNYQVHNIDIAINDRFWVADLEPTVEEWITWAQNNEIIPEVIDFISDNPNYLEESKLPSEMYMVTPSRRSWEWLSNSLKNNKDIIVSHNNMKHINIFKGLCNGFIGHQATSMFIKELIKKHKISPEDVVTQFDKKEALIKSLPLSEQNYLIDQIAEKYKDKFLNLTQIKNLFKFFKTLSKEMQVNMWEIVSNDFIHPTQSQFAMLAKDIIMDNII